MSAMSISVAPGELSGGVETLQNAVAATGNGVAIDVRGHKSLSVEVTGTFVGTVTFEGTIDPPSITSPTWVAVGLLTWADGAAVTSATAVGNFKMPNNLILSQFRARVSAYTSGNITARTLKHPR